ADVLRRTALGLRGGCRAHVLGARSALRDLATSVVGPSLRRTRTGRLLCSRPRDDAAARRRSPPRLSVSLRGSIVGADTARACARPGGVRRWRSVADRRLRNLRGGERRSFPLLPAADQRRTLAERRDQPARPARLDTSRAVLLRTTLRSRDRRPRV